MIADKIEQSSQIQSIVDTFNLDSLAKQRLVLELVQEAINYACQKHDMVLVCNPVNKHSFSLIYDGASTKPHYIVAKTQRENLAKGYILYEISEANDYSKPITININKQSYTMIQDKMNQTLKLSDALKNQDRILFALCDNEQRYVTSDLDVLMIIPRSNSANHTIHPDKNMGYMLTYEYDFAESLNLHFESNLKKVNPHLKCLSIKLIQHGPFNRFNGTKQAHIHFPMSITMPKSLTRTLGSETNRPQSLAEFKDFLNECQQQGFCVAPHPNWDL